MTGVDPFFVQVLRMLPLPFATDLYISEVKQQESTLQQHVQVPSSSVCPKSWVPVGVNRFSDQFESNMLLSNASPTKQNLFSTRKPCLRYMKNQLYFQTVFSKSSCKCFRGTQVATESEKSHIP